MKSFTKKITVLFALLAATLGMAIFAACGDEEEKPDPDGFTVTVVDENNQPFTGVRVQLCEFDEETGELGICYPGVAVDEHGKAVYKNPDAKSRMEVHIQDIDNYMLYDKVAMNRGEAVTVKVVEHKPLGGDGTGAHERYQPTDNEGNPSGPEIEMPRLETFNPYLAEEGYYRVNVSEKDKIVYFAFRTSRVGKYSVQSSGPLDPRVYEIYGSLSTGWQDVGEEKDGDEILNGNRNRSKNSKNFYYEFEMDQARFGQSIISGSLSGVGGWNGSYGVIAFGISVEDDESAGKDFCIEFKYVGPLSSQAGELHEVIKANQLLGADSDLVYLTEATLPGQGNGPTEDQEGGTITPGPDAGTKTVYRFKESATNTATLKSILDWEEFDAQYELDTASHIYYLKNSDGSRGPMLVAYINPTGGHGAWDASLYEIAAVHYNQFAYYTNDPLTRHSYSDTDANGDSFIGSYGLSCNADGVYPLTQELKSFLDWFTMQSSYFKQLIPNPASVGLKTGKYFLYFCGYYRDGSEESPYLLNVSDDNTVKVTEDKSYGIVNVGGTGTYTVTIENADGLTVTYKGVQHTATGGTLTFDIVVGDTEYSEGVILEFVGTAAGTVTVKIAEKP